MADKVYTQAEVDAMLAAKGKGTVKEFKIVKGEFKGVPTLEFEGDFRPFSLGVRKVQRILANAKAIEAAINS